MTGPHRLVILYGVGGLSDVGRHAILAALERTDIEHVTVLTRHPNLILEETKWNCACPEPHVFSDSNKERMTIVPIQSWKDDNIVPHFDSATAVITALGNRQPFFGHNDAADGNDAVLHAIHQQQQTAKNNDLKRVVICSSVGVEEDWPPLEFFAMGRVALSTMFLTCSKRNFKDLTTMERHYKATDESSIDYLFVRPVGLGEDVKPVNAWALQKRKHVDKLGFDMAKLDCAQYMVEEAIHPTRHRDAVVIGAVMDDTGSKK
jgi:NAD(P)H-binding